MEKAWITLTTIVSGILTCYSDLNLALYLFIISTSLDTLTSIHANAINKNLNFNVLKKYFWNEIKSSELRKWMKKVFWEYGVYLIIAFSIDKYVLKNITLLHIENRELKLPVLTIYLFSFIELWSVGENIKRSGGVNVFEKIIHFIPEKYQRIFKNQD